jgi:hypothetical protein
MKTLEVWILVDSDGDYVASHDADALNGMYADELQELEEAAGIRRIKVTLTVPLPTPIELTGEVAAEPVAGVLKVA